MIFVIQMLQMNLTSSCRLVVMLILSYYIVIMYFLKEIHKHIQLNKNLDINE